MYFQREGDEDAGVHKSSVWSFQPEIDKKESGQFCCYLGKPFYSSLNSSHLICFFFLQNASGIYAEIDGAKNELQGKLSNLSNLSHDLVQEATDHAYNLQQEADELSR